MQIIKACNPKLWKYYLLPRRISHGIIRWLNFVLMSEPKLDSTKMNDIRISENSYSAYLDSSFKVQAKYGRAPDESWCTCASSNAYEVICHLCNKPIPPWE